MKKLVFIAAIFVSVFTSCEQEEIQPIRDSQTNSTLDEMETTNLDAVLNLIR